MSGGTKKIVLAVVALALILLTFAYFLPQIADYRDVWAIVRSLSWPWIAALLAVTVLNVITFAPPWQVALPGLPFVAAIEVTQASTALSIIVPGGAAAGIVGAVGMLRSWGFPARDIARAATLVSVWNQLANLVYPIVAVLLLSLTGGDPAVLATAALVGVPVLGVALGALVLVLSSDDMARHLGDVVARGASWARAKARRGPVSWGGAGFEHFRREAVELLRRRWHVLTLATLAGSLNVFLVLLVSLRALHVPASEVSAIEAFAAWALVRIVGTVPITPAGVGIVELGLAAALVGFGGNNVGVVASVLVWRFLTLIPTLVLGLLAAATFRRSHPLEGHRGCRGALGDRVGPGPARGYSGGVPRRYLVGPALCVLAAACMLGALAVDLDSTAAKALMAASAILFLPGVLWTFVVMRRVAGRPR